MGILKRFMTFCSFRLIDFRSITISSSVNQPPTVSETKAKFQKAYRKTIPSIYSNVVNEMLVQQHLWQYNRNYQYDEVFALGFVSVFDQVMEGFDDKEKQMVFSAYVNALEGNPKQIRADAEKM